MSLIAQEDRVQLEILANGMKIGTEYIYGISIPKPQIMIVKTDGKEVDILNGEKISDINNLKIRVIADPEFKKLHPMDASYKADSIEIILKRNWKALATTTDVNEINPLLYKAREGDCLTIVVAGIKRRASEGTLEKVSGTHIYNIPLR